MHTIKLKTIFLKSADHKFINIILIFAGSSIAVSAVVQDESAFKM